MDGHVSGFFLRPEQSRTEDDGHAVEGHPVGVAVIDYPAGTAKRGSAQNIRDTTRMYVSIAPFGPDA